jgi:hypothetical protein
MKNGMTKRESLFGYIATILFFAAILAIVLILVRG